MRILVLALTLAVVVAADNEQQGLSAVDYRFKWEVKDEYSGQDFGQEEARNGYNTDGIYEVLLPDGRKQVVEYKVADGQSGFVANVRYDDQYAPSVPYNYQSPLQYKPRPTKAPVQPDSPRARGYSKPTNPEPIAYRARTANPEPIPYRARPVYKARPAYRPDPRPTYNSKARRPIYKAQPESRPVYKAQPESRPVYKPESRPVYKAQPESRPVYKAQPESRPVYESKAETKPRPVYKSRPEYKGESEVERPTYGAVPSYRYRQRQLTTTTPSPSSPAPTTRPYSRSRSTTQSILSVDTPTYDSSLVEKKHMKYPTKALSDTSKGKTLNELLFYENVKGRVRPPRRSGPKIIEE